MIVGTGVLDGPYISFDKPSFIRPTHKAWEDRFVFPGFVF